MKIVLIISIVFLGSLNATYSQCSTKAEKQVDSIFHEMILLAEDLDYDAMSYGVNDKHKAGFIVDGIYYADYATLIETLKEETKCAKNQEITIRYKNIKVLSDNMVLLSATGTSKADLTYGRTYKASFSWTFIFEYTDNQWKVIHSHQANYR